MKKLQADIKKGIYKNIYLLYGPQSYMRSRYVKGLVKVFLPEGDEMNLTKYYGKKTDVAEVIGMAETLPFLAEKRVVVCENTELFARACDELADFIGRIPETSVLIFSEEKADMRLKHSKAVKSAGCIAEFTNLSDDDLRDMIIKRLGKEHRPITESALDLFMIRCGDDMWQIMNNLEKVISYTFGKDGIRDADVNAVCPALPQDKIFDMINAILSGNAQKAVEQYQDLVLLQSDPSGMIGLIRDQYRLMLHVKEMSEEGAGPKEMADVMGMREIRVKLALPVSRKSSKIRLTDGIRRICDTEERIRSGDLDKRVAAETLIITLANAKG